MSPIDRATYLKRGLALALLKYAGDVLIVWMTTGQLWTPLDYLTAHSLLTARFNDRYRLLWLAVWALPFVWLGVTLSMRRAISAGLSPWLSFFFFVPYLNYLMFAALSVAPPGPAPPPETERYLPEMPAWRHFLPAITAGALFGSIIVLLPFLWLQRYSSTVFIGGPVMMGAITGCVLNRRYDASIRENVMAAWIMMLACTGLVVLFAVEGVVCMVMALPLSVPAAMVGSALGAILARFGRHVTGAALLPMLVVPLSFAIEPHSRPDVHEVISSIEIDAPPDVVWRHVIAFPPIEPPRDVLFRAGIAYPMRARIEGEGVGAIRYCEFSTGPFVEPITVWEPGRRLSFDVTASPAPLRELSPYNGIAPPHIEGYLKSVRGEFRLVPLSGGRTRLEGSTWYTVDMGPQAYWAAWSNFLIHRIHMRVLDHIKAETERSTAMMRRP